MNNKTPYVITFGSLAVALITVFIMHITAPQQTTNNSASLLFVQESQTCAITKNEDASYTLSVQHSQPKITYFTDQPRRDTGKMTLKRFVTLWHQDSNVRPNVVVHGIDANTQQRFNRVFEVSQPELTKDGDGINYQAKLLDNQTPELANLKLKNAIIFIDDLHWHGNCLDHACP